MPRGCETAGLVDSKLPQEKGGSPESGHSTEVGQGRGGLPGLGSGPSGLWGLLWPKSWFQFSSLKDLNQTKKTIKDVKKCEIYIERNNLKIFTVLLSKFLEDCLKFWPLVSSSLKLRNLRDHRFRGMCVWFRISHSWKSVLQSCLLVRIICLLLSISADTFKQFLEAFWNALHLGLSCMWFAWRKDGCEVRAGCLWCSCDALDGVCAGRAAAALSQAGLTKPGLVTLKHLQ